MQTNIVTSSTYITCFSAEPPNLNGHQSSAFSKWKDEGEQGLSISHHYSIGLQLSDSSGAPHAPCVLFCVLFPLSHPSPLLASVPLHCSNEK